MASTDPNDIADNEPQAEPPPARRRRLRVLLLVGVPLVVAVVAGVTWLAGGRYVETDNAYVKADKIPISVQVAANVVEVRVEENQSVRAGALLFRLDPAPFRVAVARAEANLAKARTELEALRASYREKQAEIEVARTNRTFSAREQSRQAELAEKGFVSQAALDQARRGAQVASQQIDTLEQDLRRIAESLGGGPDVPIEKHPSYLAAQAELDRARLDLAHVAVTAPVDGIASRPPQEGQYLSPGAIAMTLVGTDLWVEANFNETDLTYVRPGQPASVHVDAFPNVAWQGTVESLAPATGSEFSVIPAQNATGNWVKIVQRVPVRIRIDRREDAPPLRAGLSTTVEIDTGHRRTLPGVALLGH